MLRDDVVSIIAQRLGQRTDLNTAIIAEMQLAQSVVLEAAGAFLPWFLESSLTSLVTVANTETVNWPADFLGIIEDEPLWLYGVGTVPYTYLKKDSPKVLRTRWTVAGIPQRWAQVSSQILLGPVPDAVYTLKTRYYAKDTVLSTNIENNWLKHAPDLMIAMVGEVMAQHYLQDRSMATTFAEDAKVARTRLYTNHEAMQHVGRVYQMGED